MNRFNTGNPINSLAEEDFYDNCLSLDQAMNSPASTWRDRFNVEKPTIDAALKSAGFMPAGFDFVTGGTLQPGDRNKAVYNPAPNGDNNWYRWNGAFPKEIAANSQPNPKDENNWVPVDPDKNLRNDLKVPNGGVNIGFKNKDVFSKLDENINITDYTNVGDNEKIKEAISKSLSPGYQRKVRIDTIQTTDGTKLDNNLTETSFVGEGRLTGPYRKFVIPDRRPGFVPKNTIDPTKLIMFTRTHTPKVVIMGDSISTEGPNAVLSSCSMWSMLKEKLSSDNLGKSITFLNRSVGGQTWLNANTKPTVYPYWYTDTNRTWLDTVQQEQPDLLFLAFGMNDANGFNSSAVVAVINKIKQWDKIPDIIFITNPTPAQTTIYPDGSGFGFTGQIFQEGRDYAAGWVRDYAKFSGFQCIDINRSMTAMRDGYDVCSGVMRFSRKISASHYVAQEACLDFGVSGVVNPSLWPIGKVLAIKSGLGDNDKVFVIRTQTGIKVEGFTSGLSTYFSKDLVYNWEGQEFILEVSVLGGRCYVHTVTNKNKMLVIDFGVVRHGGIFLPVISWQDESDSGPFSEITLFTGYGTPSYKQTITDSEIWGPSDSTADTKFPLGGNGINHFSSQGLEYVVRPTIECCNFSVGGDESGLHAGGLWVKKSNGESLYSKTVTFQTDITTAAGALFFEREPHIDVDFPRIFMDKGGSKLSFETSFHVLTTGGVLCWVVSSGDTTLNNAIRYRLCSNEVRNDVLVTIQITMRGRWK